AQRLVELGDDRPATRAPTVRVAGVHVAEELRRHDHVLALTRVGCKPVPEDLLGFLDAAARRARVFAERHGAEGKRAHPQPGSAQSDVVIEWHESAPVGLYEHLNQIVNTQANGRSIHACSCTILSIPVGSSITCGLVEPCARLATFSTRSATTSRHTPDRISGPRLTGCCCRTWRRRPRIRSTR